MWSIRLTTIYFECIKASRFWEVLITVTSSCFRDRLSNVKYGVDHLVTDFLCCSCFRALVNILHESPSSNYACPPTLTIRRPSSSAHVHPYSPFESNITNSAFFHDASVNLFEQMPFQDHEVSAGAYYNTGDPNDTTDNAGSSLSLEINYKCNRISGRAPFGLLDCYFDDAT